MSDAYKICNGCRELATILYLEVNKQCYVGSPAALSGLTGVVLRTCVMLEVAAAFNSLLILYCMNANTTFRDALILKLKEVREVINGAEPYYKNAEIKFNFFVAKARLYLIETNEISKDVIAWGTDAKETNKATF